MNDGSFELISLTSINVLNDDPGISFTSGVYTTGAGIVYASLGNFYIFDNGYETDIGRVTRVNKFDWDGATGGVEFVAAGFVPGRMLNQFSADEYDGHLRIATSINEFGSEIGRAKVKMPCLWSKKITARSEYMEAACKLGVE
ncbi:MAG: beta-propeller domain-containing protein [Pirellulaceae bacterium]